MNVRARILEAGLVITLIGGAWAQGTARVSVATGGGQGNGDSTLPSISADGRYVAFESLAYNLVPGDTNGVGDVFVHDRLTGTTERVSVSSEGTQGNGRSKCPSISADGRYVAFESFASDLVPDDTNGVNDVFVRDLQNGTTERVSIAWNGAEADGESGPTTAGSSGGRMFSADGRFIVFWSLATNLVPGDTNGEADAFLLDRQSGALELVSVDSNGMQGNGDSLADSISPDGRYVVFDSGANNLVAGDTNGTFDVFLRDRLAGTTERVSVASDGTEGNRNSLSGIVSADARYVCFWSDSDNLVPGDFDIYFDVFVRDRQTGTTEIVSVDSNEVQRTTHSWLGDMSPDGRYVVFSSFGRFVPDDLAWSEDVFLRDRWSGTTSWVSVVPGSHANDTCTGGGISADGRFVAFFGPATNLVDGDTNGRRDVFVRDRIGVTSFVSLCEPGFDGVMACPCSNPPAGPGRGCDNSNATGGAILSASGGAFLSSDSLVFTTSGERPAALSTLVQGANASPAGITYGQGVRCVSGALKRLFTKHAVDGGITAPDYGAGDTMVSARSAAKGDVIQPGQSRWYFVYYRDPSVLGGCPAASTFNATQTGRVDWSF